MPVLHPARKSGARLAFAVLALAVWGRCDYGDPPTGPASGQLTVQFHFKVGSEPLELHAMQYTNAAGNRYRVDDLRYFVSNLTLVRADGSEFATTLVHLRDAELPYTRDLRIPAVPPGDWVAVRFLFGLDDERNQFEGLAATTSNLVMQWPAFLGGGYHYMQLDGGWDRGAGAVGPWQAHLGRVQRAVDPSPYETRFTVELPIQLRTQRATSTLAISMDVNAWFASPNIYDFAAIGGAMMDNPAAQQLLSQNGAQVFSIGSVSSSPIPPEPPPPPPDTLRIRIRGFPPMPVPADNPTTVEGVALGRRLFYDPILSGDSTQSCASCHAQAFGFSDHGRRTSLGIDHIAGTRNAPALVNVGWSETLFWDGRAVNLETQALEPVPNPIEMHEEWPRAVAKLERQAQYPELFRAAFGSRTITSERTVKAIAQFQRTFVSGNSRYDRFLLTGTGLSESELRGFIVFFSERGECFHCHVDRTFTDQRFHNNGLDASFADIGRFRVTEDPDDRGKFKTPTLRNIVFSAPYMHDGRFATLEDVVEFYDTGGEGTETVNPFILNLRRNRAEGNGLTLQEKQDLVSFVKTLTDSTFVTNPNYASPFE